LRGRAQARHGRSAYVVTICPVCQFDGGGQEVMARRSSFLTAAAYRLAPRGALMP